MNGIDGFIEDILLLLWDVISAVLGIAIVAAVAYFTVQALM